MARQWYLFSIALPYRRVTLRSRYFWRGKFYGEPDDAARFSFFSRAALEFLARRQHEAPDVIHCHDWQAAAIVGVAAMLGFMASCSPTFVCVP